MCLLCAYNVSDMWTYFMVHATSKSIVLAFQERVPIVSITKMKKSSKNVDFGRKIYLFSALSGVLIFKIQADVNTFSFSFEQNHAIDRFRICIFRE